VRPKQWLKSCLVFVAPIAAGVITQAHPLTLSAVAFATFCLAASGTYCVNDVIDRHADRAHPTKRQRPVAAGAVPVSVALTLSAVLIASSLGLAFVLGNARLALVELIYVAVSLLYSTTLKRQPIIDLAAIAAGFVLRALAGGAAAGVPLSHWFLIVACFGSLFVVAGKREAELELLGQDGVRHRATLEAYSTSFLRHVRAVTSGVALMAYCLWAFQRAQASTGAIWYELSILPFVLGILRYGLIVDAGRGGAPEEVVLSDRTLQVLGLALAITFILGTYH